MISLSTPTLALGGDTSIQGPLFTICHCQWALHALAMTASSVPHVVELGGPAQDLSNFQIAPIPILSVLTCSTS